MTWQEKKRAKDRATLPDSCRDGKQKFLNEVSNNSFFVIKTLMSIQLANLQLVSTRMTVALIEVLWCANASFG